jgi:serine protease Do
VILLAGGRPIDQAEEKGVAQYNRIEFGLLPGDSFPIDYARAGRRASASLTLAAREPAESDEVELRAWGAVVHNVTARFARIENLPDARGAVLASIRPAGAAGDAEPRLAVGDVIVAVNGRAVPDVAALRAVTDSLMAGARHRRSVLVEVRRVGALVDSVVPLHVENERDVTPEARKGWLGVASQPLTPKLATRLGVKAAGGVRITRVYPRTSAAGALRVGDVIVAVDGDPVIARRPEDTDVFSVQIREYAPGVSSTLSVWRERARIEVPVVIEAEPVPASEMNWWRDEELEFAVRDIAFDDRVNLQLDPDLKGVLVDAVDPAGWASLAGLRADDVVLRAGEAAVAGVADLRLARARASRSGGDWWPLLVRRRGATLFVEITLKPLKP